jgi:hypothetical protein
MKKAACVGVAGSAATGGTLIGMTASLSGPAANLGGYAVAQSLLAGSGFAGPALATTIATLGGPVVAGGLVVAGVGGLLYGGCKLIGKLF